MGNENTCRTFGFLLVDEFALMSAASAVEPLRAANLLSGRSLYDFAFFSSSGGLVSSSSGIGFETLSMDGALPRVDILFVVAGGDPMSFNDKNVLGQLRMLAARGTPLGGISGGSVLLAKAGVLEKYRFTVHWEHFEALRATSDSLLMERRLFVIDRDRFTCAGGIAPIDMMYALIQADHGTQLARAVSNWFIHTRVRTAEEPQQTRHAKDGQQLSALVETALELMENHIADPLSLRQISLLSDIGSRQLQRRFEGEMGVSVMQCYLDIRLRKAHELVLKTKLPLIEVAHATGFVNQAHFSKMYRAHYAMSPSTSRKKR